MRKDAPSIDEVEALPVSRLGAPAFLFFREVVRNGRSLFGAVIVALLMGMAVTASWITPNDPLEMQRDKLLVAPFERTGSLLGTDQYGRDVLSRLIYGARISLMVGLSAILFETLVGVLLGVLSGYYGGMIDRVIMWIVDIIYPFPRLLLALLLVAVVGHSLAALIIVIAIGGVPRISRIIRATVLSVKERGYVVAAKAAGLKEPVILSFYILPNVVAPIIVLATLDLAHAITTEASLTFLGLGADPLHPTWGGMLAEGRPYLRVHPHLCVFPGIAITLAVLGFNSLGDALRDILDPRLGRGAWRE